MELSELADYAKAKYNISEQHKWSGFPGFSILADPTTGEWLALLMRQRSPETGAEIRRCDIKCGQDCLYEIRAPFLSLPFRMKGQNWAGVFFDEQTDPQTVFRLFDRAAERCAQRGAVVVLEEKPRYVTGVYTETALPFAGRTFSVPDPEVPQRIREMYRLYESGDSSFVRKCRNFYRQGKFMEDYTDDLEWTGDYRHYFATYHDLSIRQLRGYFTWRTHARKGEYRPLCTSLAYLYLYELLCGIGADSPEESLRLMRDFETGFLDAGPGDPGMRSNLHRWMFEFAVLHDLPPEVIRETADPAMISRDQALAALKAPAGKTDGEILEALCTFGGAALMKSPVFEKDADKAARLFAALWRHLTEGYRDEDGRDLFTAIFGEQKAYPWYPLSNAVHWETERPQDRELVLNECRTYSCSGGVWQEERYENLYFDREKLRGLLHEADRNFRLLLKAGHNLHKKDDEEWASPYIEAVITAEKRAEEEAARPVITIDLTGLEKIRQDASVTRDSLLTEEDLEEIPEKAPETGAAPETPAESPEPDTAPDTGTIPGLDGLQVQILRELLSGGSADELIRAHHLMPSVVTDTLNEALFDEFGDIVLVCEGDEITPVEDYREDLLALLGENSK